MRVHIRFFSFIFSLLLLPLSLFSEEHPGITEINKDWSINIYPLIFQDLNFYIEPSDSADEKNKKDGIGKGSDLTFYPNSGIMFGIDFNYNGFGIAFVAEYPNSQSEIIEEGKSEYIEYGLYYFTRKLGVEVHFQKYKGFYIDEPEEYHTKRPDLKINNYGINIYYALFRNAFSLKAAFNQSEIQEKWAGSPLIMISYNMLQVDADYSLIPEDEQIYYRKDANFTGGEFHAVDIGLGYAFTFTFYHFFLTPCIILGGGARYIDISNENEDIEDTYFSLLDKIILKMSLGYNGENIFTSVVLNFDATGYEKDNIYIETMSAYMGFNFGVRF